MSILKAGRPSSEKRAMTMGDISGADKMKRVNFDLPEAPYATKTCGIPGSRSRRY